jgi:golgin subfamily B member 1
MTAIAEKARAQRLERLKSALETRLDNPAATLEALMSELVAGEPHTKLWEDLHAAAVRDGKEQDLALAYQKVAVGRRLQQLEPWAQADILMHAADYSQGVLGDAGAAEGFLERALQVVPQNPDAFNRLERRFTAAGDERRMVELYSLVAAALSTPTNDLATKALNKIVPLPASAPLSEDACKRLAALAPTHPSMLEALEAHCRKTKRLSLACALIEQALADPNLPKPVGVAQRRRLIDLYVRDAVAPASAIGHVEELLSRDASDAKAREAAERLLGIRDVAPRAAAALQKARRLSRAPES